MISKPQEETKASHFNDWPNTPGLDAHYEQREAIELQVEGKIPSYVSGTLYRTGLGPRVIDRGAKPAFKVHHWFDNFSQVHRFHIDSSGAVTYNSRLTSDGLIEKARKNGKLEGFSFAKGYEPCKSFFKKVQTMFFENTRTDVPNERNIGVTMTPDYPGLNTKDKSAGDPRKEGDISQLAMKTDSSQFQMLDPSSLEPVGIAEQATLHPDLKGPMSAAHAEHDPATGDIFNYNLAFGRTGTYRVFRTSASTGKTSILTTFQHAPAYIHSQFLTENYLILCVWNSTFTMGGASILYHRNLMDAMTWDDKNPATWFVIDKRPAEVGGKGLIAKYTSDPFFSFHSVNSYEETRDGKRDIVCDVAGYDDMSILDKFYFENMLSDSPEAVKWCDRSKTKHRSTYRRYRLSSVPDQPTASTEKATLEYQSPYDDCPELPTINARFNTKKHRYVYGISDTGMSTFADSLIKYDVETHEVKRWRVHGHTGGEAIFVPDPESTDEDGGVLLTVVLDGIEGKSYLLILDAKTLQTVAKAHVDGVVGIAFHGLWSGTPQKHMRETARL
jgi:torulene dioxygenase